MSSLELTSDRVDNLDNCLPLVWVLGDLIFRFAEDHFVIVDVADHCSEHCSGQ